MLQSPGLRVSLAGAVLFALGLLSLIVLPLAIGLVLMIVGGLAVWGGFIRTLFTYYGPGAEPPPADGQR